MNSYEKTCKLLIMHCQTYPESQIQDLLKFIYQSSFGCEHLLASPETVTEYIQREYAAIRHRSVSVIEPLDGNYCRVHLSCLDHGLHAHTLGKLFYLSARKEETGMESLLQKLDITRELICKNQLPFALNKFEKALSEWEDKGYPPIRHSEAFRQAYHPAYRVIANEYISFLPLLSVLDQKLKSGTALDKIILAIEGDSASGKTTLSRLLAGLYDCTVFHMDDYFLQPHQRTYARLSEAGGNIDRERFLTEVLLPLSHGRDVYYRRFDCSTQTLSEPIEISPTRLTVIEGVYSMHPEFSEHINLSVYLEISPKLQKERILHRNSPETAKRFCNQRIPLERIYFEQMRVKFETKR